MPGLRGVGRRLISIVIDGVSIDFAAYAKSFLFASSFFNKWMNNESQFFISSATYVRVIHIPADCLLIEEAHSRYEAPISDTIIINYSSLLMSQKSILNTVIRQERSPPPGALCSATKNLWIFHSALRSRRVLRKFVNGKEDRTTRVFEAAHFPVSPIRRTTKEMNHCSSPRQTFICHRSREEHPWHIF